MSRLPTIDDCLECRPRGRQPGETSVFQRLGSKTRHNDHVERPSRDDLELEEEDKYHRPRWCPDRLSCSQKRRVQRLRNLEEAEARYLDVLRKTRPDLAEQVIHMVVRKRIHPLQIVLINHIVYILVVQIHFGFKCFCIYFAS